MRSCPAFRRPAAGVGGLCTAAGWCRDERPRRRYRASVSGVVIRGPDPAWPARFAELASAVRAALPGVQIQLDHIGSTSIPGLAAKDVIDLQATVRSLPDADSWPDQLGPFRRRAITDDHLPPGAHPGPDWEKRYWSADEPRAHLHVREAGRANQRYALLFRDYLRTHPQSAEAYQRAKLVLAELCGSSSIYADAKDPICDLIVQAAEAWAAATGWRPSLPG